MTDLGAILEQLKNERAKLDRAIAALSGLLEANRVVQGVANEGYLSRHASE